MGSRRHYPGRYYPQAVGVGFYRPRIRRGAGLYQQRFAAATNACLFFLHRLLLPEQKIQAAIRHLKKHKHYLGAHSDQHLLYCDWTKRDSLLVSKEQLTEDILDNYKAMNRFRIHGKAAKYFMPPYEWYNDSIAAWVNQMGMQLVSFTPGTRSNADYTVPGQVNYISSNRIFESVLKYEDSAANGLNGFILLLHAGTHPSRTDKFYFYLPRIIKTLKERGYRFLRIDELLEE